jgi:hypothetical protein
MSKADAFGVPDVDIVAAAEKAGEIGAAGYRRHRVGP